LEANDNQPVAELAVATFLRIAIEQAAVVVAEHFGDDVGKVWGRIYFAAIDGAKPPASKINPNN